MARTVLALREGMCGFVPEKLSRARKAARDFALGTAGQCGQLPKGRSPGAIGRLSGRSTVGASWRKGAADLPAEACVGLSGQVLVA
jgi:hypothetical protein